MYILVQFIEDDVYYVCQKKWLKKISGKTLAKWIDGNWYLAKQMVSMKRKCDLENFIYNMQNRLPKIVIRREPCFSAKSLLHEVSIENITANFTNTVEISQHQLNPNMLDAPLEDDNSDKANLENFDTKNCFPEPYQNKTRVVLNTNSTLYDCNDARRHYQGKNSILDNGSLLPQVSVENITENFTNTVEILEHQFNPNMLNEPLEDDNSEKTNLEKFDSKNCFPEPCQNKTQVLLNANSTLYDCNDARRHYHDKNVILENENLLPEVSVDNVTENFTNTVQISEHQFNPNMLNEPLEDDNSEKTNLEKFDSNKCITVHSVVNVNQWYDCIIDSQDSDCGTLNLITLDKESIDINPILAADISMGTEVRKTSHKKHACYYCKKIVYQISRHLLTVHSKEVEVYEIKELHVGHPLRKSKLSILRNKGDFEYNKFCEDSIVVRKSTNARKNTTQKYVPCPSCLGYFIKENLRHHKNRCSPHRGDRKLQGNARKLQNYIHNRAGDTLKNYVVPHMFHDEVSNHFLFDEILILYGNYLCVKYTQDHLKNHVRAQLRLLGRLMLRAKVHNNSITCCKDLMQPIHCDTIRKAIDDIAELDLVKGTYKHPFNARTLGTAIQKVIGVIKSESIKKEDDGQLKICKSFLQVFKMDVAPYLNRLCSLSEKKQKRIKRSQVKLPENSEIQKYFKYLLDHAAFHQERLEKEFSVDDWKHLAQYLLVALAVFNRKRPGEIQRLELEDFHRRQCISQKELDSLEVDDRLQADKYVRVGFGGKLGNATAILINKDNMLPGLLIMLKYRHSAGVHKNNQFVFGAPSTNENKTFSTYICHQTFLTNSGMDPSLLSFTNLRYHLATEVSKGGSSQEEEKRVSNYMSHDYTIHKNIYDQSAVLIDITKVSKHLEASAASNKVSIDRNVKRKRISSDEYQPDSPSSDEPDPREVERCLGKLQHRNLWSSEEKDTTRKYFKKELEGKELIDKEKLKEFKEKYCVEMKNRTIPMIRQWIEMEKNKFQRKSLGIKEKKPRYSTPERELLESSTEQHSLSGSEPSFQELENLIEKNPIFNRRTASSLLAKYKEMQRKKNI